MARRKNQVKLDSPTSRKRVAPRKAVYWNVLTQGCYLGYRRTMTMNAGTWHAKFVPTQGEAASLDRVETTLGPADDLLGADGALCLSYDQAKKKAEEWFPTAKRKCTGEVIRRGKYTVANACEDYVRALDEARSPSLYITRKVIDAVIKPTLGNAPVENLTRPRLQNWLRNVAETPRRKPRHGLDPKSDEAQRRHRDSANRYLTVLRAALNCALTEGSVACDGLAWKRVEPFQNVSQSRMRFLSDEEARKLVAACPPEFRLLVQAALFSGARYSELARLRVCDFDSVSSTLLVTKSKSKKSRRIFLDVEALNFFSDICLHRKSQEFVFL